MTTEAHKLVSDYLAKCRSRLFVRGEWDCAIFVADVLQILTGKDFAAGYRGGYSDREGAIEILPCTLAEMPEWVGMKPCQPVNGAVWWAPGCHEEGALGIFWQGRCLHPGRRGLISPIKDTSKVKFYTLWQQ